MILLIPLYIILTVLRWLEPNVVLEDVHLLATGMMIVMVWNQMIGSRRLPIDITTQSAPLDMMPTLDNFLAEKNRIYKELSEDFTFDLQDDIWVVFDPVDYEIKGAHVSSSYASMFNDAEGPLISVPLNVYLIRLKNFLRA